MIRLSARKGTLGILGLLLLFAAPRGETQTSPKISKSAADSCAKKVAGLENFAAESGAGKKNVTKITEEEINSYLALDLSAKYHPSLKSLQFSFGEPALQSTAVIDFDQLAANSKNFSARLLAGMLSGTHNLSVRGRIIAASGKAHFQLEEARFDEGQLPKFLVEEIVTAVGRKQKPPFDPMQPSQMPYRIDHVEFHSGYMVIYQQ
jgi:hypothetical protein